MSNCIFHLYELFITNTGLECHVGFSFAGELGYTDDHALISPSLSGLRQMVQICEQYTMEYYIVLILSNQSQCVSTLFLQTSHILHFVVIMLML